MRVERGWRMELKKMIAVAGVVVFFICVYSFLLGNGVFGGKFENDPISWYILAKGIYCGASLYLFALILEAIRELKK